MLALFGSISSEPCGSPRSLTPDGARLDLARAVPRPAGGTGVAGRARETDEGFRRFYEKEYANIAGYAYLLVRDEDVARDLTQEAFTRLLTRFIAVREPRPYLFHVVTNLARDRWKRTARERETITLLRHDPPPTDQDHTGVADAVSRLPDPHRTAVELYYFADLPVPDVAAALRRPEGTVKRLLSEARGKLALALGDADA